MTPSGEAGRGAELVLACDALRDPRDLAEVLHLASGFGARVHLLGASLPVNHWKVTRKLRSWSPGLATELTPGLVARFPDVAAWATSMRSAGFHLVGTAVSGGTSPWSQKPPARLAFLLGEETCGLREEDLKQLDEVWSLPLAPGARFYTVGQTTALLLGGCTGFTCVPRHPPCPPRAP